MQLGCLITKGAYTIGNPKKLSTHNVLVERLVVLRGIEAQMGQQRCQGANARRARLGIGVSAVDHTQIRFERPLHRVLQGQTQNTGHNRFIRHGAQKRILRLCGKTAGAGRIQCGIERSWRRNRVGQRRGRA